MKKHWLLLLLVLLQDLLFLVILIHESVFLGRLTINDLSLWTTDCLVGKNFINGMNNIQQIKKTFHWKVFPCRDRVLDIDRICLKIIQLEKSKVPNTYMPSPCSWLSPACWSHCQSRHRPQSLCPARSSPVGHNLVSITAHISWVI